MFVNSVERRIMWGDLDSLGIVFYPRFYEWIDASGHLFFEALGFNLGEVWKNRQICFGLVGTSSQYFAPGRYHQQIRIDTSVSEITPKTITMDHQIIDAASGKLMVQGMEKRICLDVSDPEQFHARDIPDDIHQALEQSIP
ncbi:MAG: acyl-CoA thioesterase [Deltaproteobacteria bacterium]|nr:acyl-CoA thioesterase [Deltaproteobacteria bacterium]